MKKETAVVDQLRHLMASGLMFRRVVKACKYVLANELEEEAKKTMKAGIVVTYMMPFGHGAGFERLGEEYTRFSGRDDLRHLHVDLEHSRNSIYAHYGPKKARKLLKNPVDMQEFDKIKVTLTTVAAIPYGSVKLEAKYAVNYVNLQDENLPKLIELCEYHADNVERDINALVKKIYESRHYPDGDYILGHNFP